ncbi:hypothetical protein MMC26_003517 [Xylographa opegraphella]|nr:hypothetical protein [Xylographa opegraphella]
MAAPSFSPGSSHYSGPGADRDFEDTMASNSNSNNSNTASPSTIFTPIPRSHPPPPTSVPSSATFPSPAFIISGGVAIYHLASARVVLCRHSVDDYFFLPKGRRDAGEASNAGAEREGFEESGYRNRLLPVPLTTLQPRPHNAPRPRFVTDPLLLQMAPVRRASAQYVLFWYVAETVPPGVEAEMEARARQREEAGERRLYVEPERYPDGLALRERVKLEEGGYEPVRHVGTGVDAEEALYESYLVPVGEALGRLGAWEAEVVRGGWEAVCRRYEMEEMDEGEGV